MQKILGELVTSGPQAVRACKAMALAVGRMSYDEARGYTAETVARLRVPAMKGSSAYAPSWGNASQGG